MANPNFPIDGQSERIDALVAADGTVYLKAGLLAYTPTGADDPAGAHIVGTHLNGTAIGGSDPLVAAAGYTGSAVKPFLVDASGRLIPVGTTAVAAAATTNPLIIGGVDTDGNVQYILTGTDGRIQPVGADAVAGAPTINPLSIAWWDGTNLRRPRTDTGGYPTTADGGYTDGAGTWFGKRIPNVFKMVSGSSNGDNNVWTPTSGKKFRLMAYAFSVTPNITTSGGAVITVKLRDNTTDMNMQWQFYAPTTAVTTVAGIVTTPWVILGDGGFLSAAANNVLHMNLSAATTGSVTCNAIGVEE